jgi:hypothetical protein
MEDPWLTPLATPTPTVVVAPPGVRSPSLSPVALCS